MTRRCFSYNHINHAVLSDESMTLNNRISLFEWVIDSVARYKTHKKIAMTKRRCDKKKNSSIICNASKQHFIIQQPIVSPFVKSHPFTS